MHGLDVHHVSLIVSDLDRALAFYQRAFGLDRVERPPITVPGIWLACGLIQLHLIENRDGSFRQKPEIDTADWHFAFRTDDFDATLARLEAAGFSEDPDEDGVRRLFVNRHGRAGFPQLYLLDPDNNIIEVNGAPTAQPPLWQPPST
mgnify:CR=1 FL=1